MQSISQILDYKKNIETISFNLYNIQSILNVLSILDEVPEGAINTLSNPEFLDTVNNCVKYTDSLHSLLTPINNILKKELYKQKKYGIEDQPYASFKVDDKPIKGIELINSDNHETESHHELDFNEIKQRYFEEHGYELKPVNRKHDLEYTGCCKHCSAPNEYLYQNGKHQYKCKACKNTFSKKTRKYDELAYYCPHCKNKLEVQHDRNDYIVYRCKNKRCSFRLHNQELIDNGDTSLFVPAAGSNRIAYHFRDFKYGIDEFNTTNFHFDTKIDLNNAHHSPHVIGIILCLYVNYGLSSRKTALMMRELYNIKVSHQTVMNYAEAVAARVQYLANNYKYVIGNIQTADETYIKVKGKTKYVFFYSDPKSKIITSWKIYDNRDTRSAIESTLMATAKYKEIPNDLTFITDANPIYNACQLFLSNYNINFELKQVVGVSNKDEVSKEFRHYKQIEERLNRTYKENYYGTNGYKSLRSANVYMTLYVTYFNFLRSHSSLGYKSPVVLKELNDIELMPHKWVELINLSIDYIN